MIGFVEKLLNKLTEKSDDAAVELTRTETTMIKYANSQPSVTQNWIKTTVSLYINREGRVYVTSIDSVNPIEDADRFLETTGSYKFVEPSLYNAILPEPEEKEMKYTVVDSRLLEVMKEPGVISDTVYSVVNNYGIEKFAGMIKIGDEKTFLATSRGFNGEREVSFINGYIRAFKNDLSGQWSFTSTRYDSGELEKMVEKACEHASLSLPKKKLEQGKKTVILSPMVFSNLVDYIADMATATSIDMGFSFLSKHKPGEKVGSNGFTLIDAPLNKDLPDTTIFDMEGVRTFNKPIFEKGVFMTVLNNTKTATRRKEKTTGNAGWISPNPWNLVISEGNWSLEEMINETRDGVLISNNWYTRLQNYIEGDFSTVGRDAILLIKNGEYTGWIERARLVDRFPRLLSSITAVSKQKYRIQWWEVETPVISPYIRIENAGITLPE